MKSLLNISCLRISLCILFCLAGTSFIYTLYAQIPDRVFKTDFQIDPEILDGCTVKLVLQPLLENAIYYGMEFMDGEGEIHVRGYRKENDVYLEVEDNGLGISMVPVLVW